MSIEEKGEGDMGVDLHSTRSESESSRLGMENSRDS